MGGKDGKICALQSSGAHIMRDNVGVLQGSNGTEGASDSMAAEIGYGEGDKLGLIE
jgi:hypothetical protein